MSALPWCVRNNNCTIRYQLELIERVKPIEKGMFDILIFGEPIESCKTFTRLAVASSLLNMKVLLQVKSSPVHAYRKYPSATILLGNCRPVPALRGHQTNGKLINSFHTLIGSSKPNKAPFWWFSSTHSLPLWDSIIVRHRDSPIPIPASLLVWN